MNGPEKWDVSSCISYLRDKLYEDKYIPYPLIQNLVFAGGAPVFDYLKTLDYRGVIPGSLSWNPTWIPGVEYYGAPATWEAIWSALASTFACEAIKDGSPVKTMRFNRIMKMPYKELLAPYKGQEMWLTTASTLLHLPEELKTTPSEGGEMEILSMGGMPIKVLHTKRYLSHELLIGAKDMHPYHVKTFPLFTPKHELLVLIAPPKHMFA